MFIPYAAPMQGIHSITKSWYVRLKQILVADVIVHRTVERGLVPEWVTAREHGGVRRRGSGGPPPRKFLDFQA